MKEQFASRARQAGVYFGLADADERTDARPAREPRSPLQRVGFAAFVIVLIGIAIGWRRSTGLGAGWAVVAVALLGASRWFRGRAESAPSFAPAQEFLASFLLLSPVATGVHAALDSDRSFLASLAWGVIFGGALAGGQVYEERNRIERASRVNANSG